MSGKNLFGGGNALSLYTPMSDLEREVLARLIESGELQVVIKNWGVVNSPKAKVGDLRLDITFNMVFDRPPTPVFVWYFDLELRTQSGMVLSSQRQSVMYDGKPIQVAAGVELGLCWIIAIQDMDPKLVKSVIPGAIGLTNRWVDKDSGKRTLLGNNNFTAHQKRVLLAIRKGEAFARKDTARLAAKAAAAEAEAIRKLREK